MSGFEEIPGEISTEAPWETPVEYPTEPLEVTSDEFWKKFLDNILEGFFKVIPRERSTFFKNFLGQSLYEFLEKPTEEVSKHPLEEPLKNNWKKIIRIHWRSFSLGFLKKFFCPGLQIPAKMSSKHAIPGEVIQIDSEIFLRKSSRVFG